ncbi:conserved hypothetical protein [[Clostridium] ultunense Esp]|nr:conserved hypothetical protein [[Clostridium] ultunense Esp]
MRRRPTSILTGKGIAFKESLEEEGGYRFPLDEKLVGELNGESATFLEMVSTYAYLLDSGYGMEQAKMKAEELKPHLAGHLEEAVRFYHEKIKPTASRG